MSGFLGGIFDIFNNILSGTSNNIQANSNNEWQYKMLMQQLLYQKMMHDQDSIIAQQNIKSQKDIADQNYKEQVRFNNMQYDTAQQNLAEQQRYNNMQFDIAQQNLGLQQNQFDYQKRLNQLQMEREDTSMRRQIEDLKAAGLSPLMASGGASSAPLSSAPAPQMDYKGNPAQLDLSSMFASQYNGSGILNAQNNYLSLRQQALALMVDTMNKHADRHQQAYQFEKAQKQSARIALAQLMRQSASDLNSAYLQNKNLALQADKLSKQNELIDEQINASKQQREWMSNHGYRNENWETYVISILDKLAERGTIPEKVSDIVENAKDKVKDADSKLSSAIRTAAEAATGREWSEPEIKGSRIWNSCTAKETLAIMSTLAKSSIYPSKENLSKIYDLSPFFKGISKERFINMSRKECWNLLYREELPK